MFFKFFTKNQIKEFIYQGIKLSLNQFKLKINLHVNYYKKKKKTYLRKVIINKTTF